MNVVLLGSSGFLIAPTAMTGPWLGAYWANPFGAPPPPTAGFLAAVAPSAGAACGALAPWLSTILPPLPPHLCMPCSLLYPGRVRQRNDEPRVGHAAGGRRHSGAGRAGQPVSLPGSGCARPCLPLPARTAQGPLGRQLHCSCHPSRRPASPPSPPAGSGYTSSYVWVWAAVAFGLGSCCLNAGVLAAALSWLSMPTKQHVATEQELLERRWAGCRGSPVASHWQRCHGQP